MQNIMFIPAVKQYTCSEYTHPSGVEGPIVLFSNLLNIVFIQKRKFKILSQKDMASFALTCLKITQVTLKFSNWLFILQVT